MKKLSSSMILLNIFLALGLMVLPACAPAGPATIKVASVSPKTGSWATYGIDQQKGMELAIDAINKGGGIASGPLKGRKFEIVIFDDKGDPKESANITQKIVADTSIFAMVGPINSSCALADAPILEKGSISMISDLATTPDLTNQGYQRIFRTYFTGEVEAKAMTKAIFETLKLKKVYILYENTDYGLGIKNALEPALKAGGEVLGVDTYTPGQEVDFSSLITKAKATNPDVVAIDGSYNETGVIIRQARTAGWNVPFVISTGNNHPKTIELAGAENLHDVYFTSAPLIKESSDPAIVAYRDAFQAKFNEAPGDYTAYAYDAVMVIKAAIELDCTTREGLYKCLHQIKDYPGISGSITFDAKGDVSGGGLLLLKFENGEYVPYTK